MGSTKTIRKAVIPVAGLGTRLLPASKVQAKELIPVLDKPLIQYVVEEAVASGIEVIILVTSGRKGLVERHFRRDRALERVLEESGKTAEAELVRAISRLARVCSVKQARPSGLGHAIGCARSFVGREPFAVLLPDNLTYSKVPCLRQLMDAYHEHPGCIVAVRKVEEREVHRCGIVEVGPAAGSKSTPNLFPVTRLIEKPKPATTVSRYGIFGRYILTPEIFSCIDQTEPNHDHEVQITDSLEIYRQTDAVYALRYDGAAYDVGGKLGLAQATVEYALRDPDIGTVFQDYLISSKRRSPR